MIDLKVANEFWKRVHKSSDCWEWLGFTIGRKKYPGIKVSRKQWSACRLSYEIHNGEIPDGKEIRHTCGSQNCVNPAHLVLRDRHDGAINGAALKRARMSRLEFNARLIKRHADRRAEKAAQIANATEINKG